MAMSIEDICFEFTTSNTSANTFYFTSQPLNQVVGPPRALHAEFTLSWARNSGPGSLVGIGKYIAIWQYDSPGVVTSATGRKGVERIGLLGTSPPSVRTASGSQPGITFTPADNAQTYLVFNGSLWTAAG